ncbi:mRNA export factor GLE1-like [Primulina eburnea]|uniref:mRNA export factor GLE1-like n=1 Tax=Primulina eburnea TaxID=1245227 RepID=UPI003C6CC11F
MMVLSKFRGAVNLELRCPPHINGMTEDPQPDWNFDNLLSELDTIEKKLIANLDLPVPFDKKQPRNLRASKKNYCSTGGFVMHVSDHGLGFSDSDTEEEVVNTSMFSGRRFGFDEFYMSDDSDYELSVDAQCHLMDKVGLAEGALHELNHEFQLYVSEEVRNKISILETNLVTENEKFACEIANIDKHKRTQQERGRKFGLQYQRTIAEALDNHLTAVQRDHEHISQLEEKRIRDDAAREEAKWKEKALIEEKIRQEMIKVEEEARLQAETAEMAEVAAEAEKQYVEEKKQADEAAATKNAVETLRNGVLMVLDYSKKTLGQVAATVSNDKKRVPLSGIWGLCYVYFQTREAYFKVIGYKEMDEKIESTDSYVERMSSIMRLYGALVQTEIGGFQNLHGLNEGWAWLASFLNSLPANLYTAVALQHFLEMSGYALYRRYRNQFDKLLRIIAQDFLKALKEGNSDSVNAKLIKVKTSIINYIESSQFKKEPEGLQLRDHLDSNDFF